MDDRPQHDRPSRNNVGELIVRVATLELLVADLIQIVREVAPERVGRIEAEAKHDSVTQSAHDMPLGLEHQRFRLHQVLDGRSRALSRRRFSSRLASRRFAETD
jgi:hypothetical protein